MKLSLFNCFSDKLIVSAIVLGFSSTRVNAQDHSSEESAAAITGVWYFFKNLLYAARNECMDLLFMQTVFFHVILSGGI